MQALAKKLNLTDFEPEAEKWVLTPEEEDAAIENEITKHKIHFSWKAAQKSMSQQEILSRISQTDWLNKINKSDVLSSANANKNYSIWQKEQREKERSELIKKQKDLQELWTAKRFYSLMSFVSESEFGKKLIINSDTIKLITAICFFFGKDQRFENELKYSFKKGLLIRGISGLGKTHLFNCIKENPIKPFKIISMIEITEAIMSDGEFQLDLFSPAIYLDDVGTEEPNVKYYGTTISFFKNFIEKFYLRSNEYNKLIISTNNSFDQIESKYGFRVRSRLKEMFNVINITGKDLRDGNTL